MISDAEVGGGAADLHQLEPRVRQFQVFPFLDQGLRQAVGLVIRDILAHDQHARHGQGLEILIHAGVKPLGQHVRNDARVDLSDLLLLRIGYPQKIDGTVERGVHDQRVRNRPHPQHRIDVTVLEQVDRVGFGHRLGLREALERHSVNLHHQQIDGMGGKSLRLDIDTLAAQLFKLGDPRPLVSKELEGLRIERCQGAHIRMRCRKWRPALYAVHGGAGERHADMSLGRAGGDDRSDTTTRRQADIESGNVFLPHLRESHRKRIERTARARGGQEKVNRLAALRGRGRDDGEHDRNRDQDSRGEERR